MSIVQKKNCRLVTKGNLDGVVCAVLLKHLNIINDVIFIQPTDIKSEKVQITCNDIMAGLPYVESAHMVFDNYLSNARKVKVKKPNRFIDINAPSVARIIYNYFGGKEIFPQISNEIMTEADKGYSSMITIDEILYPSNWVLLKYVIDRRTGLEIFSNFSTSYHQMMLNLASYCKNHTILEILSLPEIEERIDTYFAYVEKFNAQILRCATVYYNLVVIDMRKEKVLYPGNKFTTYALFPECNVSLQVSLDPVNNTTIFIAGKSVIDKFYKANIWKIMSKNGGYGHARAGTCHIENNKADEVLKELIKKLKYGLIKNLCLGYFN